MLVVLQVAAVISAKQYQAKVLQKSANDFADVHNYVLAKEKAEVATRYAPYDGYTWYQLGNSIYLSDEGRAQLRNFKEALPPLRRALTVLPHRFNAVRQIALCNYALGNFTEATADFEHYLKMYPAPIVSPGLIYQLAGVSSLRIAQLGEAAYLLAKACEYDENQPNVLKTRTTVAILLNQKNTADYCYRAYRHLAPTDKWNPYELVSNAIIANKLEAAVAFLRSIHELNPDDLGILQSLAIGLARMGKIQEARTLLDQAVAKAPGNSEIRLIYGFLLYDAGDFDAAFKQLDEHLRINPKSPYRQEILKKKATAQP